MPSAYDDPFISRNCGATCCASRGYSSVMPMRPKTPCRKHSPPRGRMRAISPAVGAQNLVFGILRNKLIDVLRARQRTVSLSALDAELDGESVLDRELFKENGHWAACEAATVATPRNAVAAAAVLDAVRGLPRSPAGADRARVHDARILDFEMTDICSELTLTTNHCSVLLYRRARAANLPERTRIDDRRCCRGNVLT